MWYIVYREPFRSGMTGSFGDTGGGYFVKYKNKIEDLYSKNWVDANKYKSLGPALSRLGIDIGQNIDTMDKFIEFNHIDLKPIHRDNIISDILGVDRDKFCLLFNKGRIDKIGSNGEFLGRADADIMDYIQKCLDKNKSNNDKRLKLTREVTGYSSDYIINTKDGEDFWDGF